jgi:acetyltransferase
MKYVGEIETEKFLSKNGFNVVHSAFCSSKKGILRALRKVGVPFVMKVSGKKIVHKNKLDGIRLNVKTYSNAVEEFSDLKKIKGTRGVLFQSKIEGKEFLIGVKKTKEFGHVIGFGSGGTKVEEKKDVSFRVVPLQREEIKSMIKDTQASRGLLKPDGKAIEDVVFNLSKFLEKHPEISELDINPLIVKDGLATIVDARMVLD